MEQSRGEVCNRVERKLGRIVCDAIVDPSAESIAADIEVLATELDAAGIPEAATRVRAVPLVPIEDLGGRLNAEWLDWRAGDELRGDVEALAADAELASMFVGEALDHLGSIEKTLLALEVAPNDTTLLNDLFRPFHTVKGNASALGLATVQHFAHTVESLLDRCRSGQQAMGSTEVDLILKSVDLLTALITDIAARANGAAGRSLRAERLALTEAIESLISRDARTPTPVSAQPPRLPVLNLASASTTHSTESASDASVKVDTRKLDGLVDMVGELMILQSIIREHPALADLDDERLSGNLARLQRVTTDLQRSAMSMRMVPIRQTFQKMSRLVRDLNRTSGKQVELILHGEDTEFDRRVIEEIGDTLMHMVRNGVDHGIEPPEVRLASGKRETGRLWLRARHHGNSARIEVRDDGAGLNTARILEKAVEQGRVPDGYTPTDEALHRLIFEPGFSTAARVTEISGRGVGMDVVRRNIESLRGRIDIASTPGLGTTFSITLPLTLAIVDGLLIAFGTERFVLPTSAVRESLRPLRSALHDVQGTPRLVQLRDRLVPLVWLTDLFMPGAPRVDPADATVVIVQDDARLIALVVDRLVGKQEVIVKSLGDTFAKVRGVAGGAILGDGRIGLILDPHGIVTIFDEKDRSIAA